MKKRIQKRRQKAPTTKVTQRQRRTVKVAPKITGIDPSSIWNNDKTNSENYSTLGIISSLNKPLHNKPIKYQLSGIENMLFPSKPTRESEIFDSNEVESGAIAIKSFFLQSFGALQKEPPSEQSLLFNKLPKTDVEKEAQKKKKLSTSMCAYLEKLIKLHGSSESGLKAMQNDIENNHQQFTAPKLGSLLRLYSQST